MKTLFRTTIILAVLAVTALSAYALCNKKPDGTCDRTGPPAPAAERRERGGDVALLLASEELNLTAEQKASLEGIQRDFEKERILSKAEAKVKRMELEELLKKEKVDEGAVERKVKEIADLDGQLLLKATMIRLKARGVLTKDQLEKARTIIERRREE